MRNRLGLIVMVSLCLAIISSCGGGVTKGVEKCICGQCIMLDGVPYRTTGALSADIRSYGAKRKIDKIIGIPGTGKWTYNKRGILNDNPNVSTVRLIKFSQEAALKLVNSGVELSPEIKAILNAGITNNVSYTAVVVEYDNPSLQRERLKERFQNSSSSLVVDAKSDNFRYISSVAYLLDFNQVKKISGNVSGNATAKIEGQNVKITLRVEGKNHKTLDLPGKQRLAYNFDRICWRGGQPITGAVDYLDRFKRGDGKICKKYGASSKYPGPQ